MPPNIFFSSKYTLWTIGLKQINENRAYYNKIRPPFSGLQTKSAFVFGGIIVVVVRVAGRVVFVRRSSARFGRGIQTALHARRQYTNLGYAYFAQLTAVDELCSVQCRRRIRRYIFRTMYSIPNLLSTSIINYHNLSLVFV